jgi:ABC-type uncharacterized transport system fused permease/ATPase subunit
MIFGWKKHKGSSPEAALQEASVSNKVLTLSRDKTLTGINSGAIRFENVTLPPAIQGLTLDIPLGSWVVLYGEDDFAKALFCDLCFSYIHPESGKVQPVLKGSDVSFLGRSNTTYGHNLVDHLSCGVKENSKELMQYVALGSLSKRFHRHLSDSSVLEFKDGKAAREIELDERDSMELAEANLLLQKRKAAVIDTTTDFYQIALEQGFRHSELFLQSGKTMIWIVSGENPLPENARPWSLSRFSGITKTALSFPNESRAGYLN